MTTSMKECCTEGSLPGELCIALALAMSCRIAGLGKDRIGADTTFSALLGTDH
jgi:hypothetical protein